MALGGIDLNLLVILQALLEEGNVTHAGVRLGMPQPAVSNALARLRRHYRDELLIRAGSGYELTPLARSLLPLVRESTRLVGRTFSPGQTSQPPVGDRMFTICLSDYSMTVLGGPLLRRVHALAPDASIKLRLAARELAGGDRDLLGYDLLIAPLRPQLDGRGEVILRDRIVYVADPANPRLRYGRLTAEDLAALPHAAARFPDPGSDPAALALLQHGISPNVLLTTAGWLPLPFLVVGTDMVAAVPERVARRVSDAAGIAVIEPPFGLIEFTEAAWWHPLHTVDPGLTWLRGIVAEVAMALGHGPALPGAAPGHADQLTGSHDATVTPWLTRAATIANGPVPAAKFTVPSSGSIGQTSPSETGRPRMPTSAEAISSPTTTDPGSSPERD